jgi:hypothetical protein
MIEASPVHEPYLKSVLYPYTITLLADEEREVIFWTNREDPGSTGNSIYKENSQHYSKDSAIGVIVNAIPLDKLELFGYDFIKIDVQGAELDVLKGAAKTLESVSHILLESSIKQYNIGAPRYFEVGQYLDSIGFELIDFLDFTYN